MELRTPCEKILPTRLLIGSRESPVYSAKISRTENKFDIFSKY